MEEDFCVGGRWFSTLAMGSPLLTSSFGYKITNLLILRSHFDVSANPHAHPITQFSKAVCRTMAAPFWNTKLKERVHYIWMVIMWWE